MNKIIFAVVICIFALVITFFGLDYTFSERRPAGLAWVVATCQYPEDPYISVLRGKKAKVEVFRFKIDNQSWNDYGLGDLCLIVEYRGRITGIVYKRELSSDTCGNSFYKM